MTFFLTKVSGKGRKVLLDFLFRIAWNIFSYLYTYIWVPLTDKIVSNKTCVIAETETRHVDDSTKHPENISRVTGLLFFRNQVTRAVDPVNINQSHICWGAPPFATTCCFVHRPFGPRLHGLFNFTPKDQELSRLDLAFMEESWWLHDPFLKVWFHFDWYVKAGSSIEQPWTLLKYQLHHQNGHVWKAENLGEKTTLGWPPSHQSYQEENTWYTTVGPHTGYK